MEKILEVLLATLRQGDDCLLSTVIASSGSTPRSAGAYMLVGKKGRLYGTIGGGNLEYQAVLKGQQQIALKENFLFDYVLTAEGTADLGMICGGSCKVLFYYLSADAAAVKILEDILQVVKSKREYTLLLPLADGKLQAVFDLNLPAKSCIIDYQGQEYYAERFACDGKVYIFGGGHLAQELVPVLAHLDFGCIVLDDRKEFADSALFPGAEKVLLADFKYMHKYIKLSERDYAAVMTRGHLHDADAERFLLQTKACYIGVVGSRKKALLTRKTLLQEGFSEQQLDRIITPIGLDIGSETPAEIAISIAAQLIEKRAGKYL